MKTFLINFDFKLFRVRRNRVDWFQEMSDIEFRKRFRFNKHNTTRIVEMLRESLEKPKNTGSPLTPEQIVLTGEKIIIKIEILTLFLQILFLID